MRAVQRGSGARAGGGWRRHVGGGDEGVSVMLGCVRRGGWSARRGGVGSWMRVELEGAAWGDGGAT
jgi:hypothetical protein